MKRYKRRLYVILSFILCLSVVDPISATTISELRQEVKKNQSQLKNAQQKADEAQEAQEGVEEEMEEIDAELVNLITDINLCEEAINDKEEEIYRTQLDYDAAVAEKDEQYASMKIRIQFMYEKGDSSYLHMFFGAGNMGDMVNKAKYVEELYDYDRKLLTEYEDTVKRVQELWDTLEEDKSELETSKTELQEGQAYMEELLAQKKEEYENYSVMLTKAKQEAATYTARIKQETAQIRKLEEEERKRREEEERKRKEEEERRRKEQEALLADGDAGSEETPKKQETPEPTSSGGGKGQDIANYACKFIGNPYVAGGTSLTNGADCSGFVMSVYKKFRHQPSQKLLFAVNGRQGRVLLGCKTRRCDLLWRTCRHLHRKRADCARQYGADRD